MAKDIRRLFHAAIKSNIGQHAEVSSLTSRFQIRVVRNVTVLALVGIAAKPERSAATGEATALRISILNRDFILRPSFVPV